ncbi:hypothetical protein LTR85_001022 [Meristemomyces frigidus]|nr:hypothetical protein LTR85_001022 [Meristemomyces frigidus]
MDSWHSSVLKTVDWRANDEQLESLSKIDYASSLYYPVLRSFWDVFFQGDFGSNGKAKFISHRDEIRSLVTPENLLEYNISTGWKPLCKFLHVPAPDRPFPHVNDGEHFVKRCKARNHNQMKNVALRYALNGVGLAVVLACSHQA